MQREFDWFDKRYISIHYNIWLNQIDQVNGTLSTRVDTLSDIISHLISVDFIDFKPAKTSYPYFIIIIISISYYFFFTIFSNDITLLLPR